MALILANKCTWLQVHSVIFHYIVYQISKVCIALMYIQQRHMVYGEFHIYPYLVLDQNANGNAYSTPLRNKVWNVDHKMIIQGIDLCYNKCSYICVQRQHYPEYDTVCLSIFFHETFFFLDQWHHLCGAFFQMLLEFLS